MKNAAYHISFIGAGNVAWHLAPALENVGHFVNEVYTPDGKSAKKLVGNLYNAKIKESLDFSDSPSQIFILAVPDDAIQSIAQEIKLPEQSLMVHTSGSKGLDVLEYSSAAATGVFYPLQTFSKSKKLDFENVPFLLESENKEALKILNSLAKSLSKNIQIVSTAQRKQMHLAAVFACNFTNHMMSISEKIMKNAQLDFSLLHPLISETIEKSLKHSPKSVQTGPAKRGDLETLDKHMEMLQSDENVQEIYRLISQNILDNQ
ncbi:Rossmann-like and DUF2520 domain-containing protein [Marivirga sp.]|uniref:Rossmann-like and DUF2520 domain-containing protein n=1 Tax=Marivirga sp. TaxID=2018662 RepID=UPI002D804434|nr:Rossmann-like and DUF2520 domain-containing protein [Marivirga sp.]HET8861124.1 Rossmann-like and DUF2520 domain-containing protein [Marivirga sp.]